MSKPLSERLRHIIKRATENEDGTELSQEEAHWRIAAWMGIGLEVLPIVEQLEQGKLARVHGPITREPFAVEGDEQPADVCVCSELHVGSYASSVCVQCHKPIWIN